MTSLPFLAWFYWNPPREAFSIPFFDHPVYWYGVLFVTGFVLGYFILNPIFARFLIDSRHLSALDITDWPSILETLRTSSSPLISQLMKQLDLSTHQQLKQESTPAITPALQQGILEGLNRLLQHSSVSRSELEQLFGKALATAKQTAYFLTDRLCWFVVIGTIVGARLGLVFFYEWPYFRDHPGDIIKVWQGGLASHGGFLGVIISLYLYLKYMRQWIPQLSFLRLLDYACIPTLLVSCFIRLGNWMNQEILGTPTQLPWGVIFGQPADGSSPIPRHPVQLYEAGAYLLTFFILWALWKKRLDNRPGALIGLAFIMGFGFRFVLEFWKSTQESVIDSSFLQMGQLLSLPFILVGAAFLWRALYSPCCSTLSHRKRT